MNAQKVERLGIEAVLIYEAEHGRTAIIDQGKGYDVSSKGPDGERHIEVKAQSKADFPGFLRLGYTQTPNLFNDLDFWVYKVHSVQSGKPVIVPISRMELLERKVKLFVEASVILHRKDWRALGWVPNTEESE